MVTLLLLGVIGGILTTIAGMGGGMFLVVAITAMRGAHDALAITTPALLVSNLHRAWLFRTVVDTRVVKMFALGAVPAAAITGFLVPSIPEIFLSAILVGATLFTLARVLGLVDIRPRATAITSVGAGIGALTATAGGAGLLVGPLFLSTGLKGNAYVGSVALAAVALHTGRVLGYGAGGLFGADFVPAIAALLVGLLTGNLIGKQFRARLGPKGESRVEIGTLVVCTALAVAGVAR
jgi:hypothetical protein